MRRFHRQGRLGEAGSSATTGVTFPPRQGRLPEPGTDACAACRRDRPSGARLAERFPLPNPLRVVHLGKYYPPSPGGIEGHTQTLARTQAELGAEVRVLVVNHAAADGRDATFERFTRTPDAEDHDGAVQVTRVRRWANVAKLDVTPGIFAAIRRLVRWKPDVWHLHTPNVTMTLAVLASPAVRPLVITHHSDIVRQRLLKYVIRPLETAVYRRAVRVLPTSPAYVEGSGLLK